MVCYQILQIILLVRHVFISVCKSYVNILIPTACLLPYSHQMESKGIFIQLDLTKYDVLETAKFSPFKLYLNR